MREEAENWLSQGERNLKTGSAKGCGQRGLESYRVPKSLPAMPCYARLKWLQGALVPGTWSLMNLAKWAVDLARWKGR